MIFLISTVFLGIGGMLAFADDDEVPAFSPSHTIQVVSEEAELFLGDKSEGKLPLGRVYHYTEERDGWLFLPRRRAWVHSSKVLPIEKSEAHFTAILTQEKKQQPAAAYHHRAIARQELEEPAKALEDLNEAMRLGLKSSAIYVNRGNAWHALGKHANAMADFDRALQLEPDNALAYHNRALCWVETGNLGRAQQDATHAIRLDPTLAEAYNNRGVIHRQQEELQRALSDYTEAIHLYTNYAEAFANRGYVRVRLGEFGDALQDYQQAMALAPESPQAYNDAAWLMATCPDDAHRDGDRAVDYAQHACRLTSFKEGEFIDTLAAAYAEAGKFETAIRTQQQANTLLSGASRKAALQRLKLYQAEQPYRLPE